MANAFAKAVVHGVSRAAMAYARGQKVSSAFWSGFVASGFSVGSKGFGGWESGTAISAVVSGTVSKITGGKFANGAVTGAFVHLFNDSWQFGVGASGGAGVGSTYGRGFYMIHDESKPWYKGWDLGWYDVKPLFYGGAFAGVGGGVTIDFTWSDNDFPEQLSGKSLAIGGSVGLGAELGYELGVSMQGAYNTHTISVGLGGYAPVPFETHIIPVVTELNSFIKDK